MGRLVWSPSESRIRSSLLYNFIQESPLESNSYSDLHRWSIENMEDFWSHFWEFSKIIYTRTYDSVLDNPTMPGARWFSGSELNYAENLLAGNKDQTAIISTGEGRDDKLLTFGELNKLVAAAQHGLKEMGVTRGTRIAAFVPNCAETVILMLAATAIGAVWTSCSPDFGSQGVVDRFGQVEPSVLVVSNGYNYNGKIFSLEHKINGVLETIDTIEHVISIEFVDTACKLDHPSVIDYQTLISNDATVPEFVPLPFDHPLYIMYSSGTTGPPKSIIHGAGGTLIQHLKEHQLQCDIQKGRDTLFWFTTCGWMMWNWLVSGLASGATVVLYDGSPGHPDLGTLWRMAERTGITHFGTSPKFLAACSKSELVPENVADLSNFRSLLSTGSPLISEQFDWVYENVHSDIQVASISGGTDIIGCFLAGSPILPVHRGELQCAQLGMDVQSWDPDGKPVFGQSGELVCTRPFPSMPIGFWNDENGSKYQEAYFDDFERVWTHGDYIEMTANGGAIIYGRSDTTLNPGGVRIGTAEIYRAVEKMEVIVDSVVVGRPNEGDVDVVLCVKLIKGTDFNEKLESDIRGLIRSATTPRHVPKYIFEVDDIPYTISGKKVEKAVLATITGRKVGNKDALANPESLKQYSVLSF